MNYWSGRTAFANAIKLLIAFFGFFFLFSTLLSQFFKVPFDQFRRQRLVIEFGDDTGVLTIIWLSSVLSSTLLIILARFFFDFQIRCEVKRITLSKIIFFAVSPLIIILPSFFFMLFLDREVVVSLGEGLGFSFQIVFFLLVAAVTEEVVFRCVLFRVIFKITRKINFTVLLTSLLFALAHIQNGLPFVGFLNIFLSGVLLGLILVVTRSLVYASIFHFSWNFFQGPILGYRVSGLTFPSLFDINFEHGNLLNGGSFGLEGSLVALFFLTLAVGLGFLKWTKRV
jgi:membrane protease YdiL (CAAX protease family)